jgi:hypothetical protein
VVSNHFTVVNTGAIGLAIAGGNTVDVHGNSFYGNPGAVPIDLGTTPVVFLGHNHFHGFTADSAVQADRANCSYLSQAKHFTVTIDPPSIGAGLVGFVDVGVADVNPAHRDVVVLNPPSLASFLIYVSHYILSAGLVRIFLWNTGVSTIDDIPRIWSGVHFNQVA